VFCDECSKPIIGQYFFNPEKDDGKKFCNSYCTKQYYQKVAMETVKKINWKPIVIGLVVVCLIGATI
jgi:hypothetical protein